MTAGELIRSCQMKRTMLTDRATIAPRRADEVEQVEMSDWVSGWLAVGYMGDPIAGYARLAEGSLGQVIASFTLMLRRGLREL